MRGGGRGGVGRGEGGVRGRGRGGVLFSLFLSSLLSFSLPSFSLLFTLSLLSSRSWSSLSSLSNNDNDHSSSRALSVHTRL